MNPKYISKEDFITKYHDDLLSIPSSYIHSIKDEHWNEFVEKMEKYRIELDRIELGGNKVIHKIK